MTFLRLFFGTVLPYRTAVRDEPAFVAFMDRAGNAAQTERQTGQQLRAVAGKVRLARLSGGW